MGRRSKIPLAEREEAVLCLLRKEEPARVIARRFGVSEQTLYRWRDLFLEAGRKGLRGRKRDASEQRIAELEKELDRRARAVGELTLANDLLRKLREYPR